MTREQVMMSVGYPVSSENHNLEDKTWRFWLSSFQEFRVRFDDGGRVVAVEGDGDAKSKVLLDYAWLSIRPYLGVCRRR